MDEPKSGHLLRVLGVAFSVAAVIGGTIGQGILRSPGVVATGVSDAKVIIALWVLGGVFAIVDAMSTVELASSIKKGGGDYVFATRAYGRFAGLAAGLGVWLGYTALIAFVAVIFGDYLHRLGIATSVPVIAIALALILLVGAVQALGTKISSWSQELVSALKAMVFIILILALLSAPRGEPVTSLPVASSATLLGVIVAMRAIVGTYLGWNAAAFYSEEMTDPGKSIARGIFGGIILVTLIYVLMNIAFLSVLTPQEMAGAELVAADAAGHVFGPRGDTIVNGVSLISLISIINISMMTFPRLLFAMARDSGVPAISRVAKNGSPQYALVTMVVVSALFALIGVYEILLAYSVWLVTAVAVSTNIAAIVMRRREPTRERPYKMPWFPLPSIFSALVNSALLLGFLYESPKTALQATALVLGVTALFYLLTRGSAAKAE